VQEIFRIRDDDDDNNSNSNNNNNIIIIIIINNDNDAISGPLSAFVINANIHNENFTIYP
jgi:hypothetical protein